MWLIVHFSYSSSDIFWTIFYRMFCKKYLCSNECMCCNYSGVDLLVDQPFSLETLTSLVELTRFETLTPRFSATVPPCWVEVQQEQQQRRHPQHLHQQHHGDAAQHTRTWKLQTDRYIGEQCMRNGVHCLTRWCSWTTTNFMQFNCF